MTMPTSRGPRVRRAPTPGASPALRRHGRVLGVVALLLAALLLARGAWGQDPAALRARREALAGQLANSPFARPLVLESSQSDNTVKGDVYALVEHPYALVGLALQGTDHWCDILMLHLNVKDCRSSQADGQTQLSVAIGRKFDQPLSKAYRVDFSYRVLTRQPDYLAVLLSAEAGPLGTRDYRILLEAVALDARSSFLHMSYAYAFDLPARLAMQAYLATLGRDKVGFSVVDRGPDGGPVYVGGLRGVVERNAMRYYLAIEAFLDAYKLPPAEQAERRLRDWFDAVERYPRQLHEMDRDEYLSMKRHELERRRAASPRPG